jgi:hypothetical protein
MTMFIQKKLIETRPLFAGLFSQSSERVKKEPGETADIYEHRMDVVGFEEHPRFFFTPSWKQFSLAHPKVQSAGGDGGMLGVLVIDIDELATVGSGSSKAAAPGANALQSALLGVSAVLAFWFGTRTSVQQVFETTETLRDLGIEKNEILAAAKEAGKASLSSSAYQDLQHRIRLLLEENREETIEAKVSRIFSGWVSGGATAAMGLGAVLEMPFFSSSIIAAGGILLQVSAPMMSIFAAVSAGQQAYRAYKTKPALDAVRSLAQRTKDPNSLQVYALLESRLKAIRNLASAQSASWIAMGIGVPLTIFGGPIGLVVMLPGAVGCIVAAYLNGSKVEYTPQLSWQELLAQDSNELIINSVQAAYAQFALLTTLKKERSLLYPRGSSAPWPIKVIANGIASIKRKRLGIHYPPSQEVFFSYLDRRLALHIDAAVAAMRIASQNYEQFLLQHGERSKWTTDEQLAAGEFQRKVQSQELLIGELTHEQRLLGETLKGAKRPDEGMFCLLRFFIQMGLFGALAEKIMKDRVLFDILKRAGAVTVDGDEHHLNANKIIMALAEGSLLSDADKQCIADRSFEFAEKILFTVQLGRERFRQRQLLDLLAMRIVGKEAKQQEGVS